MRPVRWKYATAGLAILVSLFLIDKVCGLIMSDESQFQSLVLPPSETTRYEFRDFQFTVSTNRLGFRGPEFQLRRIPDMKRILILGNSFTYGWGVNFEFTWPHLLENQLNASGMRVEVANVSRTATTGLEMIDVAARSIPLLKPDLVVISVLQGGSLTTLAGPDPVRDRTRNARSILLSRLMYILPNYVQLLQVVRQHSSSRKFTAASVIQREQINAATSFIQGSEQHRHRFKALDPATADRFINGALNAGIVMMALDTPNFWLDTVNSGKMIDTGVTGMRNVFSSIKSVSEANGANAIVVSMPYGAYLGGGAADNLRRLGFNIPNFLYHDQSTEDQIRRAADEAGVQFVSVLKRFQAVSSDDLFIPFDGHYSSSGNKLYAELLSTELMRLLPSLARWNSLSAMPLGMPQN
jgi:hypothetical protein